MSTKKNVKKATAKKAPAKKSAPAKKAPAKKPAPAKKAPAKKPAPAKKAPAKKPAAGKGKATRKTGSSPLRVKVPVAEPTAVNEDTSAANRDFAYSIAEMMKRESRRQEEESSAAQTIRLSRRPTTRAKGKTTLKFPAADLAEFKKRLLQLRQKATGQSATLKNIALEQADVSGREDDDGSDAFLRLQSLSQADSQNKIVFKIDEALRRIADGTYGKCEICGQLIRKPRLMNMPFAHTCMECQCEMESASAGRR